ncbi:MAG TPA: HEAT repeat domain-containing protein [Candidatus Angelobacter sp.]|nr:HEAT repeat domain-containing protein [Candidatus Angelobacter sp.]
MKKSRKNWLTILAFVLLAGVSFFALRPREPAYHGRTLRSWLMEFEGGYESANTNAITAIKAIGTNGLAILLAELEYKEPAWQKSLSALADKVPIIDLRSDPPGKRNHRAANAFRALGADGKPAIPELANLIFQNHRADEAAIALAGIGQDALPELANALSHTNARIRMAAVGGLRRWRGDAGNVVPLLIKALTDESHPVRLNAVNALGELAQEPVIAVPALIQALRDKSPAVRLSATVALEMFGKDAEAALPALRKLKEQEGADSMVAPFVDQAVKRIQEKSKAK